MFVCKILILYLLDSQVSVFHGNVYTSSQRVEHMYFKTTVACAFFILHRLFLFVSFWKVTGTLPNISFRFAVSFRRISRLAYVLCFRLLRWFELANIRIQVTVSTKETNKWIYRQKCFYRKSISRNTTHTRFHNLQAILTGQTLKG